MTVPRSPQPAAIAILAITVLAARALRAEEPTATGPIAPSQATAPTDQPSSPETPSAKTSPAGESSPVPRDPRPRFNPNADDREAEIERLLASMTLAEKIGQMCQVFIDSSQVTPEIAGAIRRGAVGSILNAANRPFVHEVQRIAQQESPAGIPLLIGRDVIHGYRTIFPIPLGQAASWHPQLVERAASIAADEAAAQGINWTFAPMVDVCRDARWGRIAETLGEDPVLASQLAAAMVRGFQREHDGRLHGLVACPKHFAAYGLAEGGRDYNRVSLSLADLHNVHLPPFRAAIDAGARTLMTTFSEVNGVPGTAHRYLLGDVLRDRWKFNGFVVSDWNSVIEMVEHGYSADAAQAAEQAALAGVDMEMVSTTFHDHLSMLVDRGAVPVDAIDAAVRRILRVKLALAPKAWQVDAAAPVGTTPRSAETARRLARESLVLLKNDAQTLPLNLDGVGKLAVIGPLADDAASQLGCWAVDGVAAEAITPLEALRNAIGDAAEILYAPGAASGFSTSESGIAAAVDAAEQSDAVLLFVGEDALLSGEARSRATLDLPGAQAQLVRAVAAVDRPLVLVVLAGRPLAIAAECAAADAVLYAWHPGTMGGPAIADVLFGQAAPSGKLPVTIPKTVGQTPLYYARSNTGRPSRDDYAPLSGTGADDLPQEQQYRSHYLDCDPLPLYPFGYGLTYTTFEFSDLELGAAAIRPGHTLAVRARVRNAGARAAVETVQLYARDLVATTVRPVRELKAFRRVHLKPGEAKIVEFALRADQLAFVDAQGDRQLEPGRFAVFVGGDSTATLSAEFDLKPSSEAAPSDRSAVARVGASEDPSSEPLKN